MCPLKIVVRLGYNYLPWQLFHCELASSKINSQLYAECSPQQLVNGYAQHHDTNIIVKHMNCHVFQVEY